MTYCPQCRKEMQEKIPADATTRYCAFHGADLAIQSGVAEYTDPQRKTFRISAGTRAKAPGFFMCGIGRDVLCLHYSDIAVRKT